MVMQREAVKQRQCGVAKSKKGALICHVKDRVMQASELPKHSVPTSPGKEEKKKDRRDQNWREKAPVKNEDK
ncbi:hypothetical protein VCV18_009724 [Metarhizium anisopliae]